MSELVIKYGVETNYIDVTAVALSRCLHDGLLIIPASDYARALIFSDPIIGVVKHILVVKDGISTIYPANEYIRLILSSEVLNIQLN